MHVLLRWELENYLLDPAAMADVANDAAMTSKHTDDSAVTSCLDCADELKDRTAATVAVQAAGRSIGCNPPLHGPAMTVKLRDHLSKKGHSNASRVMTTERQQIDQFDSPQAPARERWERLVRMLDGKASLKYLSCRTGTPFDEHRGGLARRIFERDAVPNEIRDYIEEFKSG